MAFLELYIVYSINFIMETNNFELQQSLVPKTLFLDAFVNIDEEYRAKRVKFDSKLSFLILMMVSNSTTKPFDFLHLDNWTLLKSQNSKSAW